MKLRLAPLLLLLMLLFAAPQKTQAQFWKKWFGKEEKRRKRPVQKPKPKKEETHPRKKQTLEYPVSKIKNRYRIDVLVPLYLDELVKNGKPAFKDKLPEKALTGINFYEGIKLAADTLSAQGYNIDVYFHDITQKELSPEELVKSDLLAETDLVMGALQSAQIPAIAGFAQKRKINFISVISPSDADISGNLFFTMLQPTLEKHCEKIREAALKKHTGGNVLLFYRVGNSIDSAAADYVLFDHEKNFTKLPLNKQPDREQLQRLLDSTKVNAICMPVLDVDYAASVLQQLHDWFPSYQLDIYGMPSWKFMEKLRAAGAYPNMAVSFTSPFYYDLTTPLAQTVAGKYKNQFGGRLGEMVFRGYETLYWYAYLLEKYGTVYNKRQSDNMGALFTKFKVKPQWSGEDFLYNENEHLYIYRYQDGSFAVNSL